MTKNNQWTMGDFYNTQVKKISEQFKEITLSHNGVEKPMLIPRLTIPDGDKLGNLAREKGSAHAFTKVLLYKLCNVDTKEPIFNRLSILDIPGISSDEQFVIEYLGINFVKQVTDAVQEFSNMTEDLSGVVDELKNG